MKNPKSPKRKPQGSWEWPSMPIGAWAIVVTICIAVITGAVVGISEFVRLQQQVESMQKTLDKHEEKLETVGRLEAYVESLLRNDSEIKTLHGALGSKIEKNSDKIEEINSGAQ